MVTHKHTSDHFSHNANTSAAFKEDNMTDSTRVYAEDTLLKDINSSSSAIESPEHTAPLHVHVEHAVRQYFMALGDELPTDLYELILMQVELPLLTVVLEQTRGNQTKCAQILGLNRGTLRKKLKTYNLMS